MPSGNFTIDTAYCTGATMPFLEAPNFDPTAKAALKLFVPGIAGPNAQQSGCTIDYSGDNTVFELSWQQPPMTNQLFAIVTVTADYLYTVSDRDKLWKAFAAFRRAFDGLEKSGCLVPGGAGVLSRRVAQALPLSFDETLQYTYGLGPQNRCVDLTPGLRMCIERGAYQYVAPPSFSGGARNAYAAAGTSVFEIRRRADGTLGFNALMDRMQSIAITAADPPQIAGALDLESAGTAMQYGRLVYPPQLDNVTYVDSSPDKARNAVLIFAATLSELDTATDNYVQGGDTAGVGQLFFFSGRDAVWVEVPVFLNNVSTFVPLGTTLTDLMAAYFTVSPNDALSASFQPAVWRFVQPSLFDPSTGASVAYAATQVQFNQTIAVTGNGMTQWDLPLFPGDAVGFTHP